MARVSGYSAIPTANIPWPCNWAARSRLISPRLRGSALKCRIGVDDQDPEESLFTLVDLSAQAGVSTFVVHARKAWLQGLSPKQNRDVPPLDYDIVYRLKASRPDLVTTGRRDLHPPPYRIQPETIPPPDQAPSATWNSEGGPDRHRYQKYIRISDAVQPGGRLSHGHHKKIALQVDST